MRRFKPSRRVGWIEPLESRRLLDATPIVVGNSSFESAVGADGSPVGVSVWNISGAVGNAFNPTAVQYANAADNSQTGGALASPADQRQVLFINGANSATQVLGDLFAANTTYVLTVAVGNRADDVMQNCSITLLAGSTPIASAVIDGETGPSGGFQDLSATFTPSGGGAGNLVGQPLGIRLTDLNDKQGAIQANFDNVRLTADSAALPDLSFATAAATGGAYHPGDTIPVDFTPALAGGVAGSANLQIVLSANASAGDADDLLLLDQTITSFGSTVQSVTIPSTAADGDYFLIATLDPSNLVAEADETNNVFSTASAAISVSAPVPPVVSAVIGGLDPTFGDGGSIRPSLGLDRTVGVRQQADGKLIVGGVRGEAGSRQLGLARVNTDGSPDLSFGEEGSVFAGIAGLDTQLVDIDLLPDGRILAAGTVGGSGSDFFVARYTADGSPDPAFGAQGVRRIDFAGDASLAPSTDVARDLLTLPDGRIVVAGRTGSPGGPSQFAVARLGADGSLDETFGNAGRVQSAFDGGESGAQSVAVGANDTLVTGGFATVGGVRKIAVARFLADGSPDKRFGKSGQVTLNAGGVSEQANAVAVDRSGNVLLAGYTSSGDVAAGTFDSDCVVARLTPRGVPDRHFGGDGITVTGFGQPASPSDILLRDDGRVLISCVTNSAIAQGGAARVDLALERFTADGALDPTFSEDGQIILPTGGASTAAVPADAKSVVPPDAITAFATADPTAADALEAFQNSSEGKLANRQGGGAFLAATDGASTVIAALVTRGVELSGTLLTSVPTAVIGGAKGATSVQVLNVGDTLAQGVMQIRLYTSTDPVLSGGDTAFLTLDNRALKLKPATAKGKPKTFKIKFNFPANLPDGAYYLLAQINASDSIAELNTANNAAPSTTAVHIAKPFVDLSGPPLPGGATLTLGKPTMLRIVLANVGNTTFKGPVELAPVFSTDAASDAQDVALSPVAVSTIIKPGAHKTVFVKVTPLGLAAARYFLLMRIDPLDKIDEGDETNNVILSTADSVVGV